MFNLKSNIIGFGKYSGISYKIIEERDPAYILWCVKKIPGFKERYTKNELKEIRRHRKEMKELKKLCI